MRRWAIGLAGAALIVGGVQAKGPPPLDPNTVNDAPFAEKQGKGVSPAMIKAQVLLDRARFSPGVIDGRAGGNAKNALAAFQNAQGLTGDGQLTKETWDKLTATSGDPVLIEYTISDDDVKGPFLKKIPAKMEDMKGLDRLAYTSPLEGLAEKFHMDEGLLKALNPGKTFDKAGTSILVANIKDEKRTEKLSRIEVDKSAHVLRAFGKDNQLMAVYPASIGSEEKPAPSGSFKVNAVAPNPSYTYNPKYQFKGVKSDKPFTIKPGPNNPVGAVWIDLSLESYGIHGTPEPSKVGKSYSHGCVRLTNWDVRTLAQMVEKGTPVDFVN